jgi:hypothetical protein
MYPILVSKDMDVIDGHRRLACAVALGWDDVPVLVTESESKDDVYAEVNSATARLSGSETLQVWLAEPDAVTKNMRTRCENAESALGRPLLARIARHGLSLLLLRRATEISRYVGAANDQSFLPKAVSWLIRHRAQSIVNSYIKMGHPPRTLFNCIKSGKELAVRYVEK